MKRFRLKQGPHEIELPPGEFCIGRSPDCQLTLDDPLVSRRHVLIHVRADAAVLEDLGSRNGVMVNGERLRETTVELSPGDRLLIGSQELLIVEAAAALRTRTASFTQPIPAGLVPPSAKVPAPPPPTQRPPARPTPEPEPETRRASAFTLLLGVANKAFALGKVEDAERILANLTTDWERQFASGVATEVEGLDDAAALALQIAGARSSADWVDWIFRAYRLARRVLPANIIDQLHAFVRRRRYPAGQALRAYVESLRDREPLLKPAERFLLKRVEGLLEVAAAN